MPATNQTRLHVVLESADRRFLRLAGFLLARRGHRVTTTANSQEASDVIGIEGADAVIVDRGWSTSAAAVVAHMAQQHPDVPVIVVSDAGGDEPTEEVALDKWSADVLARTVEDAGADAGVARAASQAR